MLRLAAFIYLPLLLGMTFTGFASKAVPRAEDLNLNQHVDLFVEYLGQPTESAVVAEQPFLEWNEPGSKVGIAVFSDPKGKVIELHMSEVVSPASEDAIPEPIDVMIPFLAKMVTFTGPGVDFETWERWTETVHDDSQYVMVSKETGFVVFVATMFNRPTDEYIMFGSIRYAPQVSEGGAMAQGFMDIWINTLNRKLVESINEQTNLEKCSEGEKGP